MLLDYFNRQLCYTMCIDGRFSTVKAARLKGSEYRYLPTITHKKNLKCHLVLNHQDYESAIVEFPDLPEREIPQAIHWEAVKLLGANDTLLVDYYHLPVVYHDQKKMVNVVVVAKDTIQSIKEKAVLEKLHLNKITVPEIIYKSANIPSLNGRRFCVIIANEEFGKVVIVENGEVYFSRKFNLSYDEKLAAVDYESLLLLELQRSLDYCERQYRMVMPTDFLLVGDGVSDTLTSRLKDNVSLNISTQFPWDDRFSDQQELSSDHRFLLSASYL